MSSNTGHWTLPRGSSRIQWMGACGRGATSGRDGRSCHQPFVASSVSSDPPLSALSFLLCHYPPRQTKPKNGRFASCFAKTGYLSEFRVFSPVPGCNKTGFYEPVFCKMSKLSFFFWHFLGQFLVDVQKTL